MQSDDPKNPEGEREEVVLESSDGSGGDAQSDVGVHPDSEAEGMGIVVPGLRDRPALQLRFTTVKNEDAPSTVELVNEEGHTLGLVHFWDVEPAGSVKRTTASMLATVEMVIDGIVMQKKSMVVAVQFDGVLCRK